MSYSKTEKPDFVVTQCQNPDNPSTEDMKLELTLKVKGNDTISLDSLTSLATDTIIDCALSKYPHRITKDPMNIYRTRSNNDYLAELAEREDWQRKDSQELLATVSRYNRENF